LILDVTDASHIRRAVEKVDSLDILINAGVVPFDDLTDPSALEQTGRRPSHMRQLGVLQEIS
jgi:hypothetical protein